MLKKSTKANPVETLAESDRDASQTYYWTQEWQDSEKQARADIQAGRVTNLNGTDEIEAHFNGLAKQTQAVNEERNDISK